LKIADLRDMCESKGLSNRGKKEELVARLSESARGPPQSSSTRDERAANRERARKRSRPETEKEGEFDQDMSPHSRVNSLQVNVGPWLTWLISQGTNLILFPILFPNKISIAEGEGLQRNQRLDRPLGTECASTVEGQIFANSVLIRASVHDRRAFVNMVDR